ncbi:MAG: AAA domain-containing protein [Acidobacteriota bacterium]|nr:AAA domain-containing protein [Acidobacteriota bacterium]
MSSHWEDSALSLEQTLRVLEFWHKVEFFIPYDLDRIAKGKDTFWFSRNDFATSQLPWMRDPKLNVRGDFELASCWLYLGIFSSDDIDRACRGICPPESPDSPRYFENQQRATEHKQSCIARLKVSKDGIPDFAKFSVSTLPWALGYLQRGELRALSSDCFLIAKQDLARRLHNLSSELDARDDSVAGRLRSEDIVRLTEMLFAWTRFEIEEDGLRICPLFLLEEKWRERRAKDESAVSIPTAQEKDTEVGDDEDEAEEEKHDGIDILNSFYLEDIQQAIALARAGQAPPTLRRYLSGAAGGLVDLESEEGQAVIRNHLRPDMTNRGRWFESSRRQMSLMQQFAINTAFQQLQDSGLYSVNGPPGTGKTTMLKDFIANNVVARARALSRFDKPAQAFKTGRLTISFTDGKPAPDCSLLDDSLVGFEMIVASSNNAAVQNVSEEFPFLRDEEWAGYFYIRPVACKIAAAQVKGEVVPIAENKPLPWGLVSAVLGKKANRQKFVRHFYNDPEPRDSATRKQRRAEGKYLSIGDWAYRYKGPSFARAKRNFEQADRRAVDYLASLQRYADLHEHFAGVCECDFTTAEREQRSRALEQLDGADAAVAEVERKRSSLKETLKSFEREQQLLEIEKPKGFARLLFRSKAFRNYRTELAKTAREQRRVLQQNREQKENLETRLYPKRSEAQKALAHAEELLIAKKEAFRLGRMELTRLASEHDVPTPAYRGNADKQLTALWQDKHGNRLRSELFAAAIQLHEAWIAAAIKQKLFSGNCLAIAKLLEGKRPTDAAHVLAIWQSLFLITPVISTTFASCHSMFQGIPPASLGWLFIDEAGQAVPQAAIGALCKTKRALVIGDPMQIEPIFTVPIRLIELLADDDRRLIDSFSPHVVSAQVLADRSNRFGAWIEQDNARLWVGSPLRVHRRCSDPMFAVANAIAYEGKMVQGKTDAGDCGSTWIHVAGQTTKRQYVPAQGRLVFEQIVSRYRASGELPAVYLISPFRQVAESLQELFGDRNEWRKLLGGFPLPTLPKLREWIRDRIGTVHTFQGKEENEVFLVLGADWSSRYSAEWAASRPNLLNVALTRARTRIHVVGDRELWSRQRYFDQLAANLVKRTEAMAATRP